MAEDRNAPSPGMPRLDDEEDGSGICATCGERVDTNDWHPASTWVDEDDEFELLVFCSKRCRIRWRHR